MTRSPTTVTAQAATLLQSHAKLPTCQAKLANLSQPEPTCHRCRTCHGVNSTYKQCSTAKFGKFKCLYAIARAQTTSTLHSRLIAVHSFARMSKEFLARTAVRNGSLKVAGDGTCRSMTNSRRQFVPEQHLCTQASELTLAYVQW